MKKNLLFVLCILLSSSSHAFLDQMFMSTPARKPEVRQEPVVREVRINCEVFSEDYVNLDQAIEAIRGVMGTCRKLLDAYFDVMLEVSLNHRGEDNYRKIGRYLFSEVDAGILGFEDVKKLMNLYFSPDFSEKPRVQVQHQLCVQGYDGWKLAPDVIDELDEELRYKQIGLLEVKDDAETYGLAQQRYVWMKTVLEATCASRNIVERM